MLGTIKTGLAVVLEALGIARWFQNRATRKRNEEGAVAKDRVEGHEGAAEIGEAIDNVPSGGRRRFNDWLRGR